VQASTLMLLRSLLLAAAVAAASALGHPGVYAQTTLIQRSDVLLIASGITDPAGGTAGSPFPGQVVNPLFNPIVRAARHSRDDHEITIDVPDMNPTSTGPRAGIQEGIAAGASVTVIFLQQAGIKNPTESGGVRVAVATSPGGPAAGVDLTMQPDTPGAAALTVAPTLTLPPDSPASETSEAPLRRHPQGGFCRFGGVSAAAGAVNSVLLLAPLAPISVYRRFRS
jgi:hypothetical protein